MLIETSKLTGPLLDWAACQIDTQASNNNLEVWKALYAQGHLQYSSDTETAWRLIRQNNIGLTISGAACYVKDGGTFYSYGDSMAEAVVRAFVHKHKGDVVEIPDELAQGVQP